MALEPGETVLPPAPVEAAGDDLFEALPWIACAATNGKLLCFAAAEVKVQDKGRGTILMQLDKGERLAWVGLYHDVLTVPVVMRGKTQALVLKGEDLARHVLHRARKGVLLPRKAMPVKIA